MTTQTLSNVKIFTAISFYLILAVFSNLMVAPMFLILLLGLGSIVSGDVSGLLFSCLGLLSSLYLMISGIRSKKKINYARTALSVAMLVAIAVYAIANSSVELPLFSLISYGIFFIFVLLCLLGFVKRTNQ
jgi:hypothetical protein